MKLLRQKAIEILKRYEAIEPGEWTEVEIRVIQAVLLEVYEAGKRRGKLCSSSKKSQ